jgi:site-specific DNA-methyltransferase (adenine-specific)
MANSEIIGAGQDTAHRAPKTNTITCADCFDFLPSLPDASVDLIITDPPYSTPTVTSFGRTLVKNVGDFSIQETYIKMLKTEFERILKPAAPVFMFCDDSYYPSIFRAFYNWHSIQMLVWDKGKIGMGSPFRKRHELLVYANRSVLDYNRTDGITHYPTVLCYKPVGQSRVHGAQKPVELVRDLILGFSQPGDVVADFFMGSGTTAEAALLTGRSFIGSEISEEYCRIAEERIHALRSPAQNTKEICHTAPNSAMLQGLKPHAGGTGTSA